MKNLFLALLLIPIIGFAQTSHYDSLYKSGAITKDEYSVLVKSHKAASTDPVAIKLAHYDSLYANHAISLDEYKALKNDAFKTAPETSKVFNPIQTRKSAKSDTIVGAIFLSVGSILLISGAADALANNYRGVDGAFIGISAFTVPVGIGLLAHGGVLRHRLKRYEKGLEP